MNTMCCDCTPNRITISGESIDCTTRRTSYRSPRNSRRIRISRILQRCTVSDIQPVASNNHLQIRVSRRSELFRSRQQRQLAFDPRINILRRRKSCVNTLSSVTVLLCRTLMPRHLTTPPQTLRVNRTLTRNIRIVSRVTQTLFKRTTETTRLQIQHVRSTSDSNRKNVGDKTRHTRTCVERRPTHIWGSESN